MSNKDVFRPTTEPFRTLYDALIKESENRPSLPLKEWIVNERLAVWRAAHDYSTQHNLHIPTLEEVKIAEDMAVGHTDYAAKFAIGVGHKMSKESEK